MARDLWQTIFLIDDNGREGVKCAQTDSNQAEDIGPARFFAPSEPANHRIDEAKRKREPILSSSGDHMNQVTTDGNPADKRIMRNYCAEMAWSHV